jgi:tRNA(fMet)-specific endonuclease VapC
VADYLIDTCGVSHWYGKNPIIEANMMALPDDAQIYVSAVTFGEIACGHASSGSIDPVKRMEFLRWIDETFGPHEVSITRSTAEPYGILRARLFQKFGKKKRPEQCVDASGHSLGIDDNDLWIAAQAIENDLELITTDGMCRIKEVVEGDLVVTTWPLV